MKYFTKEWCELLGKTHRHGGLKEDNRAAVYSEEFFKELYGKDLDRHLSLQKNVFSVPFEIAYPPELRQDAIANLEAYGASKQYIERAKKKYLIRREYLKKQYNSRYPFDEHKEIEIHRKIFEIKLDHVRRIISDNILKDIADIRVFALRKATKEIIERVKVYCENNMAKVNKTLSDYNEYFDKASKSFDPNIIENMRLHDCKIIGMQQNEDSLTMIIDNTCGFSNVDQIIFKECNVIKQEASLLDAFWLYDEIYKAEEQYEIHVLLERDGHKIDFIVSAEHVLFHHDMIAP